jgi:presenilin-like A22 family membrane protease
MASLSWWALRPLRYFTGYRLYHLVAWALGVALALAALAVPFWWLGEAAGSIAGVPGELVVGIAYLWAAVLTVLAAAVLLVRFVFGRLRRTFRFSTLAASR